MAHVARGIEQRGMDVLALEIRIVGEDLCLGDALAQQVQKVADPDAHPADAGAPTALTRVDGDPVKGTHGLSVSAPHSDCPLVFKPRRR